MDSIFGLKKDTKKVKSSTSAKKRKAEDALHFAESRALGVVHAKAKKPVKKVKPKVYKLSGSFSLDGAGSVIKKTKAIHSIVKGKKGNEKEYAVTFLVKTNA